jgi:Tfp pilus assembly protein PilN
MPQSINLIPQQEVHEQAKHTIVKFSTVLSIFFVFVVAGVSAYYYFEASKVKKEADLLDEQVVAARNEINSLSVIEVSARNLDAKYKVLQQLFNSRVYYSLLLGELLARKPDAITIKDFGLFTGNKLSVSGSGPSYIVISGFVNNLVDSAEIYSNKKLQGLFKSVTLNTVTMENTTGLINYSVTLEFDPQLLRE